IGSRRPTSRLSGISKQSESITDDKGALYKIIGTFQDVTVQKTLEKTLFDRTIQLQKSNASLKVFAYISSHDLKEPLRKISLFGDRLRMLNEKKMDDQSNNLLKTIIRSSLRLQQMIDEILSVSRINTDESFENADLSAILRSAITDLESQIIEKSAIITHDELPVAWVNEHQLRQLFVNLLSNALKFSKPDMAPVISIRYDHPGLSDVNAAGLDNTKRYIRIRVTDNGIGFHQSYAEKIFAIFKRLHDKSAYKGTGIGLAICREIAAHHQGHIMAEGIPGQGASFTLLLPIRSE
ncbi:MAG: histidine kinase, partial [Chitinophagaceae bacterium]